MKILHIWSCAGVSSLIAEYMDRDHGTVSDVIITEKWDRMGLNTYRTRRFKSKPLFALRAVLLARKYDLIHVHYHSIFVPILKAIYDGPVIMHFHGTDVRENWGAHKRSEKADYILVSTADLLRGAPDRVFWLPNPVDTELFSLSENIDLGLIRDRMNLAVHFSKGADDEARELADGFGLELTIFNQKFPHKELPAILSQFEYFIDVQRDFKDRLLPVAGPSVGSKLSLEALSMGLKVIDRYGEIRDSLPIYHRPERVARALFVIYDNLFRGYRYGVTSWPQR